MLGASQRTRHSVPDHPVAVEDQECGKGPQDRVQSTLRRQSGQRNERSQRNEHPNPGSLGANPQTAEERGTPRWVRPTEGSLLQPSKSGSRINHYLLNAKLGSGGVHKISLKIFTVSELQQLYTCTIPLVNLTNEHPLAKPLGLLHTVNY